MTNCFFKAAVRCGASLLAISAMAAPVWAGDLAGAVRSAGSGAPLGDADVTVLGANRSARTDAQGRFRVEGLSAGVYTVEVRTAAGDVVQERIDVPETGLATLDFSLTETQRELIVVTGYAAAVSEAIDEKKQNSFVSDVLKSDDMGNLPNSNLTEALARLPGLNAVRNATTGEGDRITVRGLSTEYNNYSVNGVSLGGVGSPNDNFFRGVRLSFLSPEGVDKITVRKTLQPNMDGDAIGGTIDIETPTAFDFKGMHIGLSSEVKQQDGAEEPGGSVAASFANRFTDNLGVFVTGFYDVNKAEFEEVGDNGDHQPNHWYSNNRSGVTGWDYGSFQVPGWEISAGRTEVERWGLNGSVDWKLNDSHAFHVRGQYNEYQSTEDGDQLSMRNSADTTLSNRFLQVNSADTSIRHPDTWRVVGYSPTLGAIYGQTVNGAWVGDYNLSQVADRNGDGILSGADRTCRNNYSICGSSGTWDPQEFRLSRTWAASRNIGVAQSLNVGGESAFGALDVAYDVAYSLSEDKIDYGYEAGFETRVGRVSNGPWYGNEGFNVTYTDPRFPYFNLNPRGHQAVQDPSEFLYSGIGASLGEVTEDLYQARIDFTYKLDGGFLDNIKTGAKYVMSERARTSATPDFDDGPFDVDTYADFAPWFGEDVTGMFDGRYNGIHRLGQTLDTDKMISAIGADFSNLSYSASDAFNFDEQTIAAYLMGEAWLGDLQVIAGVRVENVTYETDSYVASAVQQALFNAGVADQPYRRNISEKSFTEILPSVHLNYNVGPRLMARGAVWTSYARPSIERATRPLELTYSNRDPATGAVIADPLQWILTGGSVGNPGLEPTRTTNFDASLEWYNGNSGAYSIAGFYKDIRNFTIRGSSSVIRGGTAVNLDELNLQGDIDLGPNPLADGFTLAQASNGEKARVWGVELSARQTLVWLPEPFDGLGFGINATFQDSAAETGMSWHPDGYELPFFESPDLLVNAELYWSKWGYDAYLSYNYQSEFLEDYEDFNNNPYEQAYTFVDLSVKKSIGKNLQLSFEVQNLLDSHTLWYTFGKDQGGLRAYIETGRVVSLGLNAKF